MASGPNPNGNTHGIQLSPALDRLPPMAHGEEQAVLGCLMMDQHGEVADTVREVLAPGDFYREAHRRIYRAICALNDTQEPTDPLCVATRLEKDGNLDLAGGRPYLMACVSEVPAISRAGKYARQVREAAMGRRLIEIGGEVMGAAFEQQQSADEIAEAAEKEIAALRLGFLVREPLPLSETLPGYVERVEAYAAGDGTPLGVLSGFGQLDALTCGFRPGNLTVIAGRTSQGKTALSLRFAVNVAEKGTPVVFLSLEMNRDEIHNRLLAARALIDGNRLGQGMIGPTPGVQEEWADLMLAQGELVAMPLYVDAGSMTLRDIRSMARRCQSKGNCGLLIVDYLHLIGPYGRSSDEVGRLSNLAFGLKSIAQDLNLPVIVLSQINRGPEKQRSDDKRPWLSDLKGSGAIEESADLTILIYRKGYYDHQGDYSGTDGEPAELIVAKNRHGPTGTVRVRFTRRYADFTPLPPGGVENEGEEQS